jgi:hypothetical protein
VAGPYDPFKAGHFTDENGWVRVSRYAHLGPDWVTAY